MKLPYLRSALLTVITQYLVAEEQASPPVPPPKMFEPHEVKGSHELWFDLDALFWQANQDGMGFATRSDSSTAIMNGRSANPDFDWDWGVRAGIGYKIPHDKWDLYVRYTYVHGHASDDVEAPAGGAVFPSFSVLGSFAQSASANWNADVNIGDVELGRTCWVGKWLTIRPFMGVRGVVIDQLYSVSYRGGTVAPGGNKYNTSVQNNFWGVGARMGANSLWGFGKGFGLYANGAFSLLSGNFDVTQKQKLVVGDLQYVNLRNDEQSLITAAEAALGVQWDCLFSRDRYHFGVKFGWEFNAFFDQNRMVKFVGDSAPWVFTQNNGDLSFQGLTLGIRLDF